MTDPVTVELNRITTALQRCEATIENHFTAGNLIGIPGIYAIKGVLADARVPLNAWPTVINRMRAALEKARPIVEADLCEANEHADADWIGISQEALDSIDEALSGAAIAALTLPEQPRPVESDGKQRAIRLVRELVTELETWDTDLLNDLRATPQAALLREWINRPALPRPVDDVERMLRALADHNDALRSACQVADRDGKDTNWLTLRGHLHWTLAEHHETVNAARAALGHKDRGGE